MPPKQTKRATGTVGEGAVGKKAKTTQHAAGQSVSEKSQVTRTSKNVFEKSNSKTQYFVREVKGRRMTKNGVEFLIGWRDFPLDKDDTWEPITNLPGSEHMIAVFQKSWEEEYKIKTSEQLQSVIDKRNTLNEKNAQTQHERNTAWTRQGQMETTTMRGVILRMRMGSMRMWQEARVIGQPRTPNGDSLAVFTSQQEQCGG